MTDRIRPVLAVYVFGLLGVFLVSAPWTAVWDEGTRYLLPPGTGIWTRSGWMRGAVSGLGVLDLAVAVREATAFWKALRREGQESPR